MNNFKYGDTVRVTGHPNGYHHNRMPVGTVCAIRTDGHAQNPRPGYEDSFWDTSGCGGAYHTFELVAPTVTPTPDPYHGEHAETLRAAYKALVELSGTEVGVSIVDMARANLRDLLRAQFDTVPVITKAVSFTRAPVGA